MALIATVSMEMESVKGLLWYYWYRLRYCSLKENKAMKIFPVTGSAAAPSYTAYLKFAAALAGVIATALTILMATPPGWAFLVIAVVTALGVYTVPNSSVKTAVSDGDEALTAAEKAVRDAKAGNMPQAVQDASSALKDAQRTAQDVNVITQQLPKI